MTYINAICFIIATFFAFYIPGNIFLRRLALTGFQKTVLSLGLGLCLWALQGFLFGFMGIRNLTYVYLAVTFLLWLKR